MSADLAADPGGKWLAVTAGEEILIMDVARRTVARRFTAHRSGTDVLAAAPDGRWLASAANADRKLKVWDTVVINAKGTARRTLTGLLLAERQ
jgi:WD40 repeat protein